MVNVADTDPSEILLILYCKNCITNVTVQGAYAERKNNVKSHTNSYLVRSKIITHSCAELTGLVVCVFDYSLEPPGSSSSLWPLPEALMEP